jgi:hypothetical protein
MNIKQLTNTLIDKAENLRGLLEAGPEVPLQLWDEEICAFLDALDELEGADEWECLKEK